MEGVGFLIRAGQLRFSAGMNGAEHMIIDDNMIITQILRCLCKRLDRSSIAAEFDLWINHASFHNLPFLYDGERLCTKSEVRSGFKAPFTRDRARWGDPNAPG